jgi:hypothetical protein
MKRILPRVLSLLAACGVGILVGCGGQTTAATHPCPKLTMKIFEVRTSGPDIDTGKTESWTTTEPSFAPADETVYKPAEPASEHLTWRAESTEPCDSSIRYSRAGVTQNGSNQAGVTQNGSNQPTRFPMTVIEGDTGSPSFGRRDRPGRR